jgi:hypothetical protein
VRGAAGERADALHALRAQELRLDLLLLGHVRVDEEHGSGLALGVARDVNEPGLLFDFLLGPAALAARLAFAQRADHRRHDATEIAAQHVVHRPAGEHLDGLVLADVAADLLTPPQRDRMLAAHSTKA